MKRIKWNDVRLVLMLGAVLFLYSFASKRNAVRIVKEPVVEFAGSENFITKEIVNKLLIQNFGGPAGVEKIKLDLNKVEKSVGENPMVDRAEVYTTVDGKLKAIVIQKKPVARVFEGAQSYYLDYKGHKMPLSETETAHVPLVTGEVYKADAKRLRNLLVYIYDDNFLKKNITGLSVLPTGGIIMHARGYDYDIVFGGPVNIDMKFKNYKAFLQDAVKDTLIKNYKTVNLMFTQQVVCTKK
ncbi:MAG: cell division protein FtsQ [Bacteroidota bacterium]